MSDPAHSPGNHRPAGATSGAIDALALAQALVRCPSVTPRDEGALDLIAQAAEQLGFRVWRLPFEAPGTARVENLFAIRPFGPRPEDGPHICFAGHSDVVPVAEPDHWRVDPFAGAIEDGVLIGRGAADMKGAIAAALAAMAGFLEEAAGGDGKAPSGKLSLLITGDEEGPALNGTRRVLAWMAENGFVPDFCLVGEPTSRAQVGDTIKIGRRGSLNGHLIVEGVSGHVAYPQLADNPVPKLLRLLGALLEEPIDGGTAVFEPSNLEVTGLVAGNHAHNVIPGRAEALFNIRFNDLHSGESLGRWIRERLDALAIPYRLDLHVSGEAFVTPPGPGLRALVEAIRAETGRAPELSTSGGTSDARFIKDYCAVVECGLVGASMHKANEAAPVADIAQLTRIYRRFFAEAARRVRPRSA